MVDGEPTWRAREIAETVRRACLEEAVRAHREAGLAGLCHEGAWDYALDAVRSLDLERVLDEEKRPGAPPSGDR